MLLRSASTPIMKSWTHQLTLEMDLGFPIRTTRPISMSLSSPSSSSSSSPISNSAKKILRTLSENDQKQVSKPKTKLFSNGYSQTVVENPEKEDQEEDMELKTTSLERLFSSSGLDESMVVGVTEGRAVVLGGNGGSSGGGGGCSGGGGGDEGFENWDGWDHGNESMDGYYQKMIKADPGNALLLGNYARFLKEVKGDVEKAEEYCERAILAKPSDGNVLSLYGDLIWETHKDASRAQTYFDQAVRSAPDDCYVLASYARFLWDAGEEEDGEDEINSINTTITPPNFIQKCPTP